ncbi:autotransporter domain-containing protein [Psychrobacter sp. AOP22-C1-C5]|uniref:autotransporter domain-containing protein n=1 Tax=Psychrobacter sp. AOP22-C1-C5 TaxID=3457716 RepID=UPI0040355213
MNHVYRVVFNHSLGVYQCVSELAKSRGKSSGKSQVATKLLLTPLAVTVLCASGSALAVTYDNGQTTTINDDAYFVENDTVSNQGTELVVNKLILEKTETGQPSELFINNKGTVTANDITGVVGNATIKVSGQGSSFNAQGILIGQNDGSGNLSVKSNGSVTADNLWLGNQELNAQGGNIGNVNIDNAIVNIANEVLVGAETQGNLNLTEQSRLTANQMRIGYNEGSVGEVVLDKSTMSIGNNGLAVGLFGTGTLDVKNGGSVSVNSLMTVGDATTGVGTVNLNGGSNFFTSSIDSERLVIGGEGKGIVNINNTYDVDNEAWSIGMDISEDTIIGDTTTGIGELNIDSAFVDAGNLIVGNAGSGTLRVVNNGFLGVDNISRGVNSVLSDVYFDGSTLNVGAQSNLFANFTDKQRIEIGANGLKFEVNDDITINPNAVITGNVGSVDFESGKGGFLKVGDSTLTMSANSKQWIGETLITEGVLQLNGNYTMAANESLGIALDVEDEGNLNSYGKLLVNGTANISKGELKIHASDAIQNLSGNNEWKDIVKATTRVGEFTKISDNSPLVSFYADYSDPNAVHLKMGAPTPPVVTPEPPVVTPEPPVVTPEPPVLTPEPPVVTPEPPVVTPEPPVVTPEPPVVTPEPPVVTPEPPVVTPEPPVVTPEPPVVTPEPPVVTPEPPVVTPEPPVVTPEPPVVTPEPPVTDTTFVESVNTQSQRNDVGIAYALDRAIQDQIANDDNDLAKTLISSTTNFNQNQLAAAANQLQPLFMGATNRIITDTNYAASEAVTEHRATTTERNVWAKLIGNTGSHDAENGVTGYEADSYGAIVGLDMPINSDLNLGVAVSYIDTDADTDGGRLDHKLTAKNWQVLGYGNYAAGEATHVNFHAGAGSSSVKGERHLSILTNAIARSDYDVDTLRAGLGVDHRIGSEQRHVTPFAQVNYAQAKSDSYRETGAGVYNLNVDENRYESMRWTAGLKMSQYLTPQFAITGQLAAAIENGDQNSDITASFVGLSNDRFTTIGQEVGREIGIVGIGVSYMPTLKTTLSAGYRSEWRENYDDQGASIALQTTF